MTLQELDERAVETIVDFFYSGEIEISENNVQDLLPVTCVLQVQSVQQACCEFLRRQLSSENCLGKFYQLHCYSMPTLWMHRDMHASLMFTQELRTG